MKRQYDRLSETRKAAEPERSVEAAPADLLTSDPQPSRRVLWLTAAGIFVVVTALVAATADDLGLTWDEPPYVVSQMLMSKWFGDLASCRSMDQAKTLLTKESILGAWEYNRFGPNFHPPLAGMLCNLTHGALGRLLGELPARRVASGAELALAAAVLFLFLARRYSYWVGGIAATSLVLMPRVFGDAHIAGTDMPLMAFWGFTALAFWNGLESRAWRVGFGVLLGLSLLVKFTALLLVVPLVAWLIFYRASWRGFFVGLISTAVVAWPLGLAGIEIVRLSEGIRRHTQRERMLRHEVTKWLMRELPEFFDEQARSDVTAMTQAAQRAAFELMGRAVKEKAEQKAKDNVGQEIPPPTLADFIGHGPPFGAPELQVALERLKLTKMHEQNGLVHSDVLTDLRFLAVVLGSDVPLDDVEMRTAATTLMFRIAHEKGVNLSGFGGEGIPPDPRQIKFGAERLGVPGLAIDSFVAWVQPKFDLGVTTRVPGWVFFLPLVMWLGWGLFAKVPFAPRSLRESGSGLWLWLAGLAIAPAVAIALNPTWWHETLPQLAHYYQISVGRQGALPDIEIFYLGKKHIYSLPWHNGWVLIAVTVPTAILASSLVGFGTAVWNWRRDPLAVFFVLNMITLPVSRMLPTPAHDGVRLMLPTFFFLAGLAGLAFQLFERMVDRLRSEEFSTAPVLSVAALLLLGPPAYWLFRAHPHELSYYNGLVGGLPGAQRLGFEPTYWYDAVTPAVLREMNDPNSKRGLPIAATLSLPEPRSILEATMPLQFRRSAFAQSLPEPRINPEVFDFLKKPLGKLRADIRLASDSRPNTLPADDFPYVALLTHSSKASPFTRLLYALKPLKPLKPQLEWDHDGVRLFSLYSPRAVARAWGLWLLLDATDYSQTPIQPRVDRELIELAKGNYRAMNAAALLVTEHGIDAALESQEDAETMSVIRKLAARGEILNVLLARRGVALVEAIEILSRAAERRPDLLERLVESYDGYLPASELGEYLDETQASLSP